MLTATVEEVQTSLPEILAKLAPGEPVVIYRDGAPIATLTNELPKGVPIIGRGEGMLISYIDDDEHLKDFEEYMS